MNVRRWFVVALAGLSVVPALALAQGGNATSPADTAHHAVKPKVAGLRVVGGKPVVRTVPSKPQAGAHPQATKQQVADPQAQQREAARRAELMRGVPKQSVLEQARSQRGATPQGTTQPGAPQQSLSNPTLKDEQNQPHPGRPQSGAPQNSPQNTSQPASNVTPSKPQPGEPQQAIGKPALSEGQNQPPQGTSKPAGVRGHARRHGNPHGVAPQKKGANDKGSDKDTPGQAHH